VEYKKQLKTFKAGRENIFGGICRIKPTDRNEKLPRATNDIHGFCIGWHPGKNPPDVGVRMPIENGPNIDAILQRRSFNTDRRKSPQSLT
jgi:hypothetical protein